MTNRSEYEFYAGKDNNDNSIWSKNLKDVESVIKIKTSKNIKKTMKYSKINKSLDWFMEKFNRINSIQ